MTLDDWTAYHESAAPGGEVPDLPNGEPDFIRLFALRHHECMYLRAENRRLRKRMADTLLPEPSNDDIVRTSRYLGRLSERWHDHRTSRAIAEAIRADADAKERDARERADVAARTDAALAEDEHHFDGWA